MFLRALPQPKHSFHSTKMDLIFELPYSKNPNERPDKVMFFCFSAADVRVEFILCVFSIFVVLVSGWEHSLVMILL